MSELPSKDELEILPFRAILAYALRCARRVRPLNLIWLKEESQGLETLLWADRICEYFIQERAVLSEEYDGEQELRAGTVILQADHEAAYAAIYALRATVYTAFAISEDDTECGKHTIVAFAALASEVSAYACAESEQRMDMNNEALYEAGHDLAASAARFDIDKLFQARLGEPGTLGLPIDLSDSGPLGNLWPIGTPNWYSAKQEKFQQLVEQSGFKLQQ